MEETPAPAPQSKRPFPWKALLAGALIGIFVGIFSLTAVVLASYTFFQKAAVTRMAETKDLKPLLLRADLDWTVDDLDGQPVSMKTLAGQPLLLHFWNPTCVSCVAEIASLNALYDAFQAKGLAFAAVALHADDALAVDVAENKIRFPVYRGDSKTVPPVFTVTATPTTYVIDRDGFILLHHTGAVDWMNGDGPAFLERLLNP